MEMKEKICGEKLLSKNRFIFRIRFSRENNKKTICYSKKNYIFFFLFFCFSTISNHFFFIDFFFCVINDILKIEE